MKGSFSNDFRMKGAPGAIRSHGKSPHAPNWPAMISLRVAIALSAGVLASESRSSRK